MFTYVRTNSMAPGQWTRAMAFAHESAAYLSKLLEVGMRISVPMGGDPNVVAWSAEYESMAAIQAATEKMLGDAKFREMLNQRAVPRARSGAGWPFATCGTNCEARR